LPLLESLMKWKWLQSSILSLRVNSPCTFCHQESKVRSSWWLQGRVFSTRGIHELWKSSYVFLTILRNKWDYSLLKSRFFIILPFITLNIYLWAYFNISCLLATVQNVQKICQSTEEALSRAHNRQKRNKEQDVIKRLSLAKKRRGNSQRNIYDFCLTTKIIP